MSMTSFPTTMTTTTGSATTTPARTTLHRRLAGLGAAALAGVVLAGCGAVSADTLDATDADADASTGAGADVEVPGTTAVAMLDRGVTVHADPGGAELTTLSDTTPLGTQRVVRVHAASDDGAWLQVTVPARPNNTTGWIAAEAVDIEVVRHHITVDLSDRELVLHQDGEPVLTTEVAVGSPEHPTPTGQFFLTDKLSTDPDGAYGPFAFGISAWSETLSEFAGGDGQVGLHGTDEPGLIGQEISHGCLRVGNDVIRELAAELPLGVPVDIQA